MPRENRKRGKKHKKAPQDAQQGDQQQEEHEEEPQAGPSWIVLASNTSDPNQEAPYGYVDSEVKAYFRTVDVQIREWQVEGSVEAGDEDADPNEDRRLFFVAALTEMSGKEKELATDPDCSNILERMAYSMDDFARRVFMDRLMGSYKTLAKHRFASHVCQTFFEVASDTVSRECRGIVHSSSEAGEEGELLLMKDLISDACEELLPDLPSLILDRFASHVLRALFAVLAPVLFASEHNCCPIRSRKSVAHKARQGPQTSVFKPEETDEDGSTTVPSEFMAKAVRFVTTLRELLGANEVRALAASRVASPSLKMLLEIEADQGLADEQDSLSDRLLDGLITRIRESEDEPYPASDYVGTLLRDPTSSHLLETLFRRLPANIFDVAWTTYLEGKLGRLAAHPIANYVVAKAIERVSHEQLRQAVEEVQGVADKVYKSARTGLFRAMVERAYTLQAHEHAIPEVHVTMDSRGDSSGLTFEYILQMILKAAGFSEDEEEDRKLIVPSLLRVITAQEYRMDQGQTMSSLQEPSGEAVSRKRGRAELAEDTHTITTQGAVLLQSMLKLPSPHNQVVLDSIFSLPIDELISMAHDVTASRVLDALLQSPGVSPKDKRKFVMNFIGHYHILVDDRIGSRVGDNCWAFADPYLREKIARSLIQHERDLTASFFGKFFARNLNLYLLQRNPEQWKTSQMNSKAASPSQAATSGKILPPFPVPDAIGVTVLPKEQESQVGPADDNDKKRKKRKTQPKDEIDQLFEASLGGRVTRSGLRHDSSGGAGARRGDSQPGKTREKGGAVDKGLDDVLGAIKAAPKENGSRTKNRR